MIIRTLMTVVLVVTAYYTLPDELKDTSDGIRAGGFVLCVLGLAGLMVYLILRPPSAGVPARAEGLLLTALISIAFFATVYYRFSQDAGQFVGLQTRTDSLYFTLVTAATVGYGDIHPAGQGARIAVMVNIAFNLVFLGAGVSVALDRIKQRRRERP